MTPKRQTRAEAREKTRQALIRSASEIFAQRGYHAATVDEIAEKAGYSQGALYSNFATKEELLLATAAAYADNQTSRWNKEFTAASDDQGRSRAPADSWMSAVSENPDEFLLFMELWALAARNPPLKEAFAATWTSGRAFITNAVSDVAVAAGLRLDDQRLEDAVTLLDALGIGLAVRKLSDPDLVPDDFFGRALAELVPVLLAQWAKPA